MLLSQATVTSTHQQSTSVQESEDIASQDSTPDTVTRTPPPKNSVMSSSTATTPAGSHTTSAPVNIPSHNLSGVSTASPTLPGSNSVRVNEGTGVTNSSPVSLSTSVKEEGVGNFPGRRSSPSFTDAALVRGMGRGGLSSQLSSSVPLSSGNSTIGAVSSASDMAKRNILGADERIGSSGMVQPLVSPLSSRMILPQATKADGTGSLDSSNVSDAAALAGRVFSPSVVSGMQWRPGSEAVCYLIQFLFNILTLILILLCI